MKVISEDIDRVIVELERIEFDLVKSFLNENRSLIQNKIRTKYFDVSSLDFSNDYSKFLPKINYFKYYDINKLFDILSDKFYLKKTANDAYDDLYNTHTFKKHIVSSNIIAVKITEKLVKYNYLEVIRELGFKVSDDEIAKHIVKVDNLDKLTTSELAMLLSVSKQTIYNLKNKGIIQFNLNKNSIRFDFLEIIEIFKYK